jgi:hypothetical protein
MLSTRSSQFEGKITIVTLSATELMLKDYTPLPYLQQLPTQSPLIYLVHLLLPG